MTDRLIRITTALAVMAVAVVAAVISSLGAGIVATVRANLAHGVGHGPVGALVSVWPALAQVGSFELLMVLIRTGRRARAGEGES